MVLPCILTTLKVLLQRGAALVTPYVQIKCAVTDATTIDGVTLSKWYRAVTATIIRCLKYQKRGFTIAHVPDFSLVTEFGNLTSINYS